MRGATCHLFLERSFVALVYHPPVAQIVIYHSQQVVWNLFPHHRLDADVSSRGIERIAYVNADKRAESLTPSSSSSCFSGDVHHCLDGVNCGPAFPKAELVFRETILANHEPSGVTTVLQHNIPTTDDQPIFSKQYKFHPVHKEISRHVNELINIKIIKPS